jgi:predicted acylesterase/phospholipase RssA
MAGTTTATSIPSITKEAIMHFNLVFEGGGAKGLVFVGAMKEFERRGYTYGRVLGTSAGAITAALLAANYKAVEMLTQVNEKLPDGTPRFATFMDVADSFDEADWEESISFKILREVDLMLIPEVVEGQIDRYLFRQLMHLKAYRMLFSFLELGGLYAGNTFREWLTEKLNRGGRNLGQATLAEFHEHTQKDLTVVASDTTDNNMLVLNHRTAPDLPVVWAVRMSMSIPFIWQEVTWRAAWGPYTGRDITGHDIVDGGVNSNFPIRLLISRSREVLDLMGPHDGHFALGMLIDEKAPVPGVPAERGEARVGGPLDLKNMAVVKRVSNLLNTMTSAHDKVVIDAYKDGVCRLPAAGYGTTEFDMSDEKVEAIIKAGAETMHTFFEGFRLPGP